MIKCIDKGVHAETLGSGNFGDIIDLPLVPVQSALLENGNVRFPI